MKQNKDSVDVEQLYTRVTLSQHYRSDLTEAEPAHATPTEAERIINTVKAELVARMLPLYVHTVLFPFSIIESVDSISRDGPDTPIYIIHYKKRNNSEQVKL